MAQDQLDLARQREAMNPPKKSDAKTENVIKMFADADKIAAIKAEIKMVRIGQPPADVVIRPLNPRQGIEAFKLLRTTLLPLLALYRKSTVATPSMADFFDAFGENIEEVPKLLHIIISRGNPTITLDWVNDNLDLVPDTLTILPIFMQQNMFDILFSPKARAPQPESAQLNGEPQKGAEGSIAESPTTVE
jgi:hypothetical protein